MRRLSRGGITFLLAALGASAATAQLLPDLTPKKPTVTRSLQTTTALGTRTVKQVAGSARRLGAQPLGAQPVGQIVAPTLKLGTNSLNDGIAVASPLLRTVAGATGEAGSLLTIRSSVTGPRQPSPIIASPRQTFVPQVPLGSPAIGPLRDLRRNRLQTLIQANPTALEADDLGQPIVRGRMLLLDPHPTALRRATSSGFQIISDVADPVLGVRTVTLSAPRGLTTREALRRLRAIAPGSVADYDHIYEPAGGKLIPASTRLANAGRASGVLIGMVDGGVAAHPALAGRVAEQRSFAGTGRATAHGTAVASLLVGNDRAFRGSAARGASLVVADVYGGQSAAGSASRIAQALSWLAAKRPNVINISLVGPPNALVSRTVGAVRRRGIQVVAAVGNDGPAAPPQYPASYPGVVSVTAVDSRGVALRESGNALHVDFAAPGADMAAARPGRGYVTVRGTSFAAPLAAGRLAALGSIERLTQEVRPGKGRVGRGIVCFSCRIDPRQVGAR